MKKFLQITIFILISIFFTSSSFAQSYSEKVRTLTSNIVVNKDGKVNLTWYADVNVKGVVFKHGIYFDLINKRVAGNKINPQFKVIKAEINGKDAKYSTEYVNDMYRIKIGDPNVLLNPGNYTFLLNFEATNLISFYDDHDEFYFNVIPPMTVPVDFVAGSIILPNDLNPKDLKFRGYQGILGSTEIFNSYKFEPNVLSFNSNRNLRADELITLAIWFPKNTFDRQIYNDTTIHLNPISLYAIPLSVFLISLIIVMFLFKSNKYLSMIKSAPVTFDIPKDLNPSDFRYLDSQFGDNKATTVEIINLAIKKVIKINKSATFFNRNNLTLTLLDRNKATKDLEVKIINSLFKDKEILNTSEKEDSKIIYETGVMIIKESKDKKIIDYSQGIKRSVTLFLQFLLIGIVLVSMESYYKNISNLALNFIILAFMGIVMVRSFANIHKGKLFSPILILGLFIFLLFTVNSGLEVPVDLIILSFLSIIPYFVFEYKNNYDIYSEKGIEYLAIVKGFKKFALSQENYNAGVLKEIPLTFEMYESYLPYAIALNVETQWSSKFNDVFKNITQEQREELDSYSAANVAIINSSLNNTLASYGGTGSSAFSGGGGYSGGGGGGGGGGGW